MGENRNYFLLLWSKRRNWVLPIFQDPRSLTAACRFHSLLYSTCKLAGSWWKHDCGMQYPHCAHLHFTVKSSQKSLSYTLRIQIYSQILLCNVSVGLNICSAQVNAKCLVTFSTKETKECHTYQLFDLKINKYENCMAATVMDEWMLIFDCK